MSEIVSFKSAQIPQFEADMLQEVEKQLNKEFTKVGKVEWETRMGFTAENNRITGIGLYKCGLSTLPESIGNLSSLQTLFLNGNQLTTLPESIGNLSSLQTLVLNGNQLTTLPESITRLTSLQSLDLSINKFTTLPESISKLESLIELVLSGNNLSTLPESIKNLKSLIVLYLDNNKLTTLPESLTKLESLQTLAISDNKLKILSEVMLNYTYLQKLEGDTFKTNSFTQEFINECKAVALKSSAPHEKEFIMDIVEICERRLEELEEIGKAKKPTFKEKIKNYIKENYKSFAYAGSIAFVGLFTYLVLGVLLQSITPVIFWIFFIGALIINLLIGVSIIATLSGYFKKYVETGVKAIKSTSSEKLDSFGDWIRKRLFGLFDVIVAFYFVWTIRATVKTGLGVELIPAVDFAVEYAIPQWLLNFWVFFSYNVEISFLENLDLFLGHYYLKLFGVALAFWALYRYGFKSIGKTAFEKLEIKNNWSFLVLGLFGALSLAIMEYSNLKEFLSIGYSVGAIIGCCLFIWEINKDNPLVFFIYLTLIVGGIIVVWLLSMWNIIISVVIGAVFVISFFVVRWQIGKSKTYIKYKIVAEQNKVMKDLQRIIKKPIPPLDNIYPTTFGVKTEGDDVVELGLYNCGIKTLPESIGNLISLESLFLGSNQLWTLPEFIGNLKSLKELYLSNNELSTLPNSILKLKSLQYLNLEDNDIWTLPESAKILEKRGVTILVGFSVKE